MTSEISTKDKILDLTSQILQERGYNGFSYSHISKQLGVRNAAIHYHFPTKADLGEAMIQRYQAQFNSWKEHHERKYPDQHQKLFEAYISITRSYIKKQRSICPLAVLESNFTVFPENMQLLTQTLSKDIRAWFSTILANGKDAGIFKFEGSAETKSLIISAALQGASMMANVESPEIFEITVEQIKQELGINNG
jgi:TetR/AcrR family transcriptional repressor of nem operon